MEGAGQRDGGVPQLQAVLPAARLLDGVPGAAVGRLGHPPCLHEEPDALLPHAARGKGG